MILFKLYLLSQWNLETGLQCLIIATILYSWIFKIYFLFSTLRRMKESSIKVKISIFLFKAASQSCYILLLLSIFKTRFFLALICYSSFSCANSLFTWYLTIFGNFQKLFDFDLTIIEIKEESKLNITRKI